MLVPVLPKFVQETIREGDEATGRVEMIKDRGVEVWKIADLHNNGLAVERIAGTFPELTESEVKAALFYYKRYRKRINEQINARK